MIYYLNHVNKPYVMTFDIEHDQTQMIQFAAIMLKEVGPCVYQICRSINIYIQKPGVSHFIEEYTGLTQAFLYKYGVPLEDAHKLFNDFLADIDRDDVLFVSHGILQDMTMLRDNGFDVEGYEQWCTLLMALALLDKECDMSLGGICKEAGYDMIYPHNAYADALATLMVFSYLLKIEEQI